MRTVPRVCAALLLLAIALAPPSAADEDLPTWYTKEEEGKDWHVVSFLNEFGESVPKDDATFLACRWMDCHMDSMSKDGERTSPLFILKDAQTASGATTYKTLLSRYKLFTSRTTKGHSIHLRERVVKKTGERGISIDPKGGRDRFLPQKIRVEPPTAIEEADPRIHPMPVYDTEGCKVCGVAKFKDHYYPEETYKQYTEGLDTAYTVTEHNFESARPNRMILPAEFLFVDIGKILGETLLRKENPNDPDEQVLRAEALRAGMNPRKDFEYTNTFEYISRKRPHILKKLAELKSDSKRPETALTIFEASLLLCLVKNSNIEKEFFAALANAAAEAGKGDYEPLKAFVRFWREFLDEVEFAVYEKESGYLKSAKVDPRATSSLQGMLLRAHWYMKKILTKDMILAREEQALISRYEPEKMAEFIQKKVQEQADALKSQKKNKRD